MVFVMGDSSYVVRAHQFINRAPKTGGSHEGEAGGTSLGDTGQLILLVLFLIVWTGDSFFWRQSTFAADGMPLFIRLLISAFLLLISFLLIDAGHVVIHAGRSSPGLVSTGAFRYVRHPLYLGCILFYLSLVVATVSLFSLALLVLIGMLYHYLARYEEKLLVLKYGEQYNEYRRSTGMWMPRMGGRR